MAFLADLQITNELHSLRVEGLEEVRLIKDKRTGMDTQTSAHLFLIHSNQLIGQSRGFAFAQFVGIPEARQFLDRHHPSVSFHGAYDPNNSAAAEPAKIRIAYSRDREDRDKAGKSDDDWKCEVVWCLLLSSQGCANMQKCFLANFSTRTLCFRCNAPRTSEIRVLSL